MTWFEVESHSSWALPLIRLRVYNQSGITIRNRVWSMQWEVFPTIRLANYYSGISRRVSTHDNPGASWNPVTIQGQLCQQWISLSHPMSTSCTTPAFSNETSRCPLPRKLRGNSPDGTNTISNIQLAGFFRLPILNMQPVNIPIRPTLLQRVVNISFREVV